MYGQNLVQFSGVIFPLGAELFHEDGRADRLESNSRISPFAVCTRLKVCV